MLNFGRSLEDWAVLCWAVSVGDCDPIVISVLHYAVLSAAGGLQYLGSAIR